MTHRNRTTLKQNPDAALIAMIQRHDRLWDKWGRLDERDSRVRDLSAECCELERRIVGTPAHSARGLAGKPLRGVKSTGYMTWKPPQIAQYRERHALGTTARLALELMLNIAARREDAHKIGRQHRWLDANDQLWKLTWRPSKTLRSTGKTLTIPILPNLQEVLDATPSGGDALAFLTNDYSRPFASAAAFGNKFADWCVAAGLKRVECDDGRVRNFRAHGLRKAALYTLYKAGGTVAELQALGGHGSIAELQKYIQEIEQDEQAVSGMAKVAAAQAKARTGSD